MEDKALKLWHRLFLWSDDPFVIPVNYVDYACYFCGEDSPNHSDDCIWVEAKKLIEANQQRGYFDSNRNL